MNDNTIHIHHYDSPCGEMIIGAYRGMLCLCDWSTEPHHGRVMTRLQNMFRAACRNTTDDVINTAIEQLNNYFIGNLQMFTLPMIFAGTDFQQIVWRELLNVPYGDTLSYRELAMRIGKPLAVRAVANAVGANAISIFVPCHRIIGTNGLPTGYAGGLPAKCYLLDLERYNQPLINDEKEITTH